jgi:predicted MFS family arabinose efflux permease
MALPQLRRARLTVAAVFALHGAVTGSFAARIPWINDRLQLDPASLGLALLMPALGAMAAMPFAGRLIHEHGSRAVTRWTLPAWCAAIALPAQAPHLPALCFVLLAYGAAAGVSDIAMNAQGVEVEERLGRSIMSGLHGMWSIGALLGAGVGALAADVDLDARAHHSLAAVALVAAAAVIGRGLLVTATDHDLEAPPRFALPGRGILLIGIVGFCAVFAEGASHDWTAVYLVDVTGASEGTAGRAYAVFALTMAAGRLGGDAVVARLGAVRTVRLSGVLATIGGALVVVARTPLPAFAGFALLGAGIACVVPLAFAAAGRAGDHPARSIAGVASIAYASGLAAPAAIGVIADVTSLPLAFGLVTALVVVVALGARAMQPAGAAAPVLAG